MPKVAAVMMATAMRINGIDYNIDWRKFKVGWSFFVPCLHLDRSKYVITSTTKRLGYKVLIKPVIEDGIKGLRVWRTK
jgi:hypothetical protein